MDDDHDIDAIGMRLFAAIEGVDPVLAMVALSRMMTGFLAALSPTREAAQAGWAAIAADGRASLEKRWPAVELLRTPPSGSP
jgi:hypothetical protein